MNRKYYFLALLKRLLVRCRRLDVNGDGKSRINVNRNDAQLSLAQLLYGFDRSGEGD